MAQHPSGLQQANTQSSNRREEAREQGLAEQNVTDASPPELDVEPGQAKPPGLAERTVTQPAGNTGDAAKR